MAIRAILEYAATNPEVVMAVRRNSDAEVVAAAGKGTITVVGSQTPERRSIILLDPDTGTPKTIEVQWNSALNISSDLTRSRPFGYLLKSTETHTADVSEKSNTKMITSQFRSKKAKINKVIQIKLHK